MLWVLGFMDILSALSFVLLKFEMFETLAVVCIFYLILKGLLFFKSFVSILDIVCGIVLALAYFGSFPFLWWVCALWLLQKGIFSIIS